MGHRKQSIGTGQNAEWDSLTGMHCLQVRSEAPWGASPGSHHWHEPVATETMLDFDSWG
ncbi:hypothetical protein OKW42_000755 [Paraburkholderia sp. WC7.3d]